MKKWLKQHIVLLLLLALGAAGCVGVIAGRVAQEEANRQYDIILDYASLTEMAAQSDESLDFWLDKFRELGVDKLAVNEATMTSISEDQGGTFFLSTVRDIRGTYGWEQNYPTEIADKLRASTHEMDMLAVCTDRSQFDWILQCLQERCDLEVEGLVDAQGICYLWLPGADAEDLAELPLGTLPQMQDLASLHGYTLIPRTVVVDGLNGETFAQDVMRDYEELGTPYAIGGGKSILGNDDSETVLPQLISHLEDSGITLGVIETSQQSLNLKQEGLEDLVSGSGYNAVRIFTMWDYVQWRYQWYGYDGPEEITNCLYRAAYERNCRLVYLKMILEEEPEDDEEPVYITDPADYETMVTDFMSRMDRWGYTKNTLSSAGNYTISYLSLVLIALGAVAAAVLLLGMLISLPNKWMYLITAFGCVCAAGVLYVMPNTGRLILSMGGGIALPLLSAAIFVRLADRKNTNLLVLTLGATALSLLGGCFAAAPLSDSSYMLEMQLYRGVKLMQLIPLAVYVCYFLKVKLWDHHLCHQELPPECRKARRKEDLHGFMELPIKMRSMFYVAGGVLVLAVVALVGYYYLARTGHSDGVEAATLELQIRNLLEYYLPARPRTKEFLIGYPCMMLYIWSERKNLPGLSLFLGLGAVIGMTSIVNTFLHIRTAFTLSLIRVGTGLVFGLILGLMALAVAELLYRLIWKRVHHV